MASCCDHLHQVRISWGARPGVSEHGKSSLRRRLAKEKYAFAKLKDQIGFDRLRLGRLRFVREQFFLAEAAQNIKRLVRYLNPGLQSILPATVFDLNATHQRQTSVVPDNARSR